MKVYEKSLRKIAIENDMFLWIVIEETECIYLRVYSSLYKSSYFEVRFEWRSVQNINQNRPVIVKKLIEYALDNGWDFHNRASVKLYDHRNQEIRDLHLEQY